MHPQASGDQPEEVTQHQLGFEQGLANDHAFARDLAMTPPWWWPSWLLPWRFNCKSYTCLLVGDDDALARAYCGGTTFRSVIRRDPAHIDVPTFQQAAEALKKQGIHITDLSFPSYLPAGSSRKSKVYGKFTVTIFGNS